MVLLSSAVAAPDIDWPYHYGDHVRPLDTVDLPLTANGLKTLEKAGQFGVRLNILPTSGLSTVFTTASANPDESQRPIGFVPVPRWPRSLTQALDTPDPRGQAAIEFHTEDVQASDAAGVAEGAAFTANELTRSTTKRMATVKKFGTFIPITEEAAADSAEATRLVERGIRRDLYTILDGQLLEGDATGRNLNGVENFTDVQPHAAADSVPRWRTLITAAAQVADKEAIASHAAVHPFDYYMLLGEATDVMTALRDAGLVVVPSLAVTRGEAYVGDFEDGLTFHVSDIQLYNDARQAVSAAVTLPSGELNMVVSVRAAVAEYTGPSFVKVTNFGA